MYGWQYAKESHLETYKNYESFEKKSDISQYFSPFVILFPIIKVLILYILIRLWLSDTFIDFVFSHNPDEMTGTQSLYIFARFVSGAGLLLYLLNYLVDFLVDWSSLNSHDNSYPMYKVKLRDAFKLNTILNNFQIWYFTCTLNWNFDVKGITIIFKDELIGGTKITNLWLQATLNYFCFIQNIKNRIDKHKKNVKYTKNLKETKKAVSKEMIQKIIDELEKEK